MLVSKFLDPDFDIAPFDLGTFFSRYKIKDGTILSFSQYKHQNADYASDEEYNESLEQYIHILNACSYHNLWHRTTPTIFAIQLENDLNVNEEQFFMLLLRKIFLMPFFIDETFIEDRKMFLRGFFETRGSIDTSRGFLALDYFYNSALELKRIRYLIDNFSLPAQVLNFNFRELQAQFINDINRRNTQFRVNLNWYLCNIGLINPYKAIKASRAYHLDYKLENNVYYFSCEEPSSTRNSFEDRIAYYLNTIYDKNLSQYEIEKIRKDLEFEKENDIEYFSRNGQIIKIFKYSSDDICSACSDKYDIKDRSFITKSGRYYTEIHHCISVGKDKALDVLENLTKLCPVCHRALKKGASNENYQKQLISNIFAHNPQNLEFASIIFASDDEKFLIDKVYQALL